MHSGTERDKQMPNGMRERNHAIRLEKQHSGHIESTADSQLRQAAHIVLYFCFFVVEKLNKF